MEEQEAISKDKKLVYISPEIVEDNYFKYSAKVSDIVRNLSLTGIGICWLLVYGAKKFEYEKIGIIPISIFVIVVGLDFVQYLIATWAYYYAKKSKEYFTVPKWRFEATFILFLAKIILTFLGYALLIRLVLNIIFLGSSYKIIGNVYNSASHAPIAAEIKFEKLPEFDSVFQITSDHEKGAFSANLNGGGSISIKIEKDSFLILNDRISLDSLRKLDSKDVYKEYFLIPKKSRPPTIFKNVLFETGSAQLKEDPNPELDSLAEALSGNQNKIILYAHTDSVGKDISNMLLSNNRAQTIKNYLIGKSISAERINCIGFGESKPVAPNLTAEGRQLNRRVEFEIIYQ